MVFCFPWCFLVHFPLSRTKLSPGSCFSRQFKQILLSSCSVWILTSLQHKKSLPLLFPTLFLFFHFFLVLHISSLNASFTSSTLSLHPYLLIFLTHTVISFAAVHPSLWRHSSWCFPLHLPSGESQISFSASQCAAHFCSLSCLLSPIFLLARFPVKSNPFCSIENQMGLQRISSYMYKLLAASRQVLCHLLYPKGGKGSPGYHATKAPFCQTDAFCRIKTSQFT